MSLKELFQDIFGTGAGAQQPPAPTAPQQQPYTNPAAPPQPAAPRAPLPPPPGAALNSGGGTGTEPMLAQAEPAPAQLAPQAQPAPIPHHHNAPSYEGYAAAPSPATAPPVVSEGRPHRASSLGAALFGGALALLALLVAIVVVATSVHSAEQRLNNPDVEQKPLVAIAQEAEVAYCTKDFKEVLERVLHSCGLAAGTERRGCKPADIKTFAAISDSDFNALFHPLQDRGGVLLFDEGKEDLDDGAKKLLEKRWFDRKGARYFFVVARASKTGTPAKNRALSHRRANSVLFHLEKISGESQEDLAKKVGLLWLGNEFAQLSEEYCGWPLSRDPSQEKCGEEPINRSAFVSWVDCRL